MGKKSKLKKNKVQSFDKYWFYKKSVQSPDVDVLFFEKVYKELVGKKPVTFREDFCGTFSLSCEWVKLNPLHKSFGIDLDEFPIQYGMENYLPKLDPEQQSRVVIKNENVLSKKLPKVDIIAACNFSYFIFKDRSVLKEYFANCYKTLNKSGILILDCFGGSQCYEPNEEETEYESFSYYWDQDSYDPITNEAQFYIHFKPKNGKKIKEAFSYDWRIWSIPELKDILFEAGFKKVEIYWEGTDSNGEGDGEFERANKGESCDSWIAYIVAQN